MGVKTPPAPNVIPATQPVIPAKAGIQKSSPERASALNASLLPNP